MKFFAASLGRLRKSPLLGDESADRIPVMSTSNQLAPESNRGGTQGSVEVNVTGAVKTLTVERRRDCTIVELGACVPSQGSVSFSFANRLIHLLDEEHPSTLCIDLAKNARLSSEMLNQLIQVNCHARSNGVRLVLSNLSQPLVEVFRVTRLDRLFELSTADGESAA